MNRLSANLLPCTKDRKMAKPRTIRQLNTPESQGNVLDTFAQWLARCVPKALSGLTVFGCVDVGGPEYFVKLESNVLMTEHIRVMAKVFPTAYPVLGQKFDALHPIMFGAEKLCERIASALGKDAKIIPSPNIPNFAVLRVNCGADLEVLTRRVSSWIVPFPPKIEDR
jgi:hypothetical protein